jgi:hypothetical protein
VPALDQEYTRGLTIWQHHTIRRYARRLVKDHVDIVALCRAKRLIREIVERERLLRGRIGGMQTIAHYLNVGHPDYQKAMLPGSPEEEQPRKSTLDNLVAGDLSESEAVLQTPISSQTPRRALGIGARSETGDDAGDDSDVQNDGWGADYDLPDRE